MPDECAVSIIRGDGQIVRANMFDKHGCEFFASFTARPALAFEIIAGLFFRSFRPAVTFVLPMLIHAFEPERHPAASRFQISNLEGGKFLQHAVGARSEEHTSELQL